jgi:hypothetical protein
LLRVVKPAVAAFAVVDLGAVEPAAVLVAVEP